MGQGTPNQRSTPKADLQYRTVAFRAKDDGPGFAGYASHWNSVDSYGTAMRKGAFRKTIKERGDRVPVLWQHWPDVPIGKPTELKEDQTGLKFDAAISEGTTAGNDAMTLLRDGVPLGMSFGFETIKSRPAEDADDLDYSDAPDFYKSKEGREYVRVIEEVRLWEISLVTFPANEHAVINDVRAANEAATLASLLDALKAGRLSDEQRALCAELVAAFTALQPQPDQTGTTALDADHARRRKQQIDIALALATAEGWNGVTA